MVYNFKVILILLISFLLVLPVKALSCYDRKGKSICILDIQRSAKYHWQYRASISIDDVIQPRVIYDCRQRLEIRKNGTKIPFTKDDAGSLICSLFKQ